MFYIFAQGTGSRRSLNTARQLIEWYKPTMQTLTKNIYISFTHLINVIQKCGRINIECINKNYFYLFLVYVISLYMCVCVCVCIYKSCSWTITDTLIRSIMCFWKFFKGYINVISQRYKITSKGRQKNSTLFRF